MLRKTLALARASMRSVSHFVQQERSVHTQNLTWGAASKRNQSGILTERALSRSSRVKLNEKGALAASWIRFSDCKSPFMGEVTQDLRQSFVFSGNQQQQVRTLFGGRDDDLYKILEVERGSSQSDIKKAYFRLAKKFHPDLNPDNARARVQFHRIAAAYEVLGDAEKRRIYDTTGQHGNQEHFNQSYSSSYASTDADDFARQVFEKVWQDLGLKEYFDTVKSEASTALDAARHGDYSFAWEFAKERKGLILSVVLPFAVAFRFPGLVGAALRFLGLFAVVFLRNLPPGMAWAIMRNAWIRLTRR